MTDGTILIGGDVGDAVGVAMRRGMVAVRGSCGDAAGFNMIAGSILVFGNCGVQVGAEFAAVPSGSWDRNRPNCCRPSNAPGPPALVLALLFGELARLGFPVDEGLIHSDLSLYHGVLYRPG